MKSGTQYLIPGGTPPAHPEKHLSIVSPNTGAGIPVLLTCDIHTHVTGPEPVREDLVEARRLLRDLGMRCTFFFPARSAQELSDQVAALQAEGHEIGCHGLTHVPSENYGILPSATQHEFLQQATDQLTTLL